MIRFQLLMFILTTLTVVGQTQEYKGQSPLYIIEIFPDPIKIEEIGSRGEGADEINNTENLHFGNYYALLFGVAKYDDWRIMGLETIPDEIESLYNALTTYYIFDTSKVKKYINPTREQIITALENVKILITANDNLLIYFAGHGKLELDEKEGYWWPSNANKEGSANWLSNSTVITKIKTIKSQHTLIIVDACFAGSLVIYRDGDDTDTGPVKEIYDKKSRRAITSGALEKVPSHSEFIKVLVHELISNNEKYFSSQELFKRLKPQVIKLQKTVPQEGHLHDTNDEGGDFIFIKK